jgi:hypothetical protein
MSVPLYAIKIVRLLLLYTALVVGVRVQEARYVEEVYGLGKKPPPLMGMLLSMAAFMLVLDALLIAALKLLAEVSSNKLLKDPGLIQYVVLESVGYTAFVLVAGYAVAHIVARKKYFNYKKDGLRALRAMRDILFAIIVPVSVLPVFFKT